MAGGAILPGDGGLPGLLGKATETGFSRSQQLRLTSLDDGGQEHEQLAMVLSPAQDAVDHRVRGILRGRNERVSVRIRRQAIQVARIGVEPRRRDSQGRRHRLQDRGRRIQFPGFDRFKRGRGHPKLRCQSLSGILPRQSPGSNRKSNRHGAMILKGPRSMQPTIELEAHLTCFYSPSCQRPKPT